MEQLDWNIHLTNDKITLQLPSPDRNGNPLRAGFAAKIAMNSGNSSKKKISNL